LSELGDLTQYNEFYENLVYKPSLDGDFSVMPLVVAQVNLLQILYVSFLKNFE